MRNVMLYIVAEFPNGIINFGSLCLDDGERIEWPRRLSEAVQLLSGTHHICNKNKIKNHLVQDREQMIIKIHFSILRRAHTGKNRWIRPKPDNNTPYPGWDSK